MTENGSNSTEKKTHKAQKTDLSPFPITPHPTPPYSALQCFKFFNSKKMKGEVLSCAQLLVLFTLVFDFIAHSTLISIDFPLPYFPFPLWTISLDPHAKTRK